MSSPQDQIRFSLVLASRERLPLLRALFDSLVATTHEPGRIEVLTVFDEDDVPSKEAIVGLTEQYQRIHARFFTRTRSEWMHKDYINWAAQRALGKYLVVMNDDTVFVNQHWDALAWDKLEAYIADKPDGIVYGFTDTFSKDNELCCFPLFSRKAFEAIGFLLPNERKNWSADHDIFAIYTHPLVQRKLDLPEIKIKHVAYHTGLRKRDAVSIRIEQIYRKEASVFIPTSTYADKLAACIMNKRESSSLNKVLVVYNICGLGNKENYAYYLAAINSLLFQKFDGFRVVISSCLTTPKVRTILEQKLGSRVSYNWIMEKLPLNVTFNHTVQKCVEEFGKFDAYLYVDSGVTFGNNRLVLRKAYERLTGPYAMVTVPVDLDSGFEYWDIRLASGKDYVMPVGRACNLHCQIFSHEIYENYNRKILPDIFAHHTSESVYTFLNAAIGKGWVVCHEPVVHHASMMDGPSSGFLPDRTLLFRCPKTIEQICSLGYSHGFGYEEYKKICIHDPRKFNVEGHAIDQKLLPFLREYLYLASSQFDYTTIQHHFVPEVRNVADVPIPSPQITCLITSHNKPKFVKDAIASVLEQEFQDWEAIIMDSGELFKQGFFDWITDPRITVINTDETEEMRHRLAMAPWCYNECFRRGLVRGVLVVYLCDDDVFYPNAFQVFVDYYKNNRHVRAMYASQDVSYCDSAGLEIVVGERRAIEKRGSCTGGLPLDCQVDYLQFCHTKEVLSWLPNQMAYWPEERGTEKHADGVFMERIGDIVPVYNIDIKIGQNRRTPISVYCPSK